jgi:hypothetical protein
VTARTVGAVVVLALAGLGARSAWAQYPYPSKVDLRFDHWHDYEQMTEALQDLAEAYPELLTLDSIGKSVAGRDLWLVTLNNPETGPDSEKAAIFIDGNIHGNEIQGGETVLYTIWYLTKSYGRIERLTKLINERAFYLMPMENPDGREVWFHQPATSSYLRGGVQPTDNDYDGLYDEDPPDDLDGDGHITTMWKQDPLGRYKRDPEDERFFARRLRPQPQLAQRLAAQLHPVRRRRLPLQPARDPGHRRVPAGPPQHRRLPELSQRRRDDPAGPGRRVRPLQRGRHPRLRSDPEDR